MLRVARVLRAVPAIAAAVVAAAACNGGGGTRADAPNVSFDRNALLTHLATNVLLPIQAQVAAKAAALPPALTAYCDALDTGNQGTIATTRGAAEDAWRAAIDAWERADQLLVGPAAME